MNPSTALATVLVDELVRRGVREAVLSPGSRSAPLAFALHDADRAGRLRLHVRIDERTAGFLALGLAKASRRPVPVVTTSGTAAVNLHPALVEADYAGVPVMALTADRPAELRGVGANQTIDQVQLFGGSVRFFVDLSVDDVPDPGGWRAVVADGLAAAATGPVHLNVAFRDPLVPDVVDGRSEPPGVTVESVAPPVRATTDLEVALSPRPRTVVVAGDGAGGGARVLAEANGWPLLAEPTSGARSGPNALAAYRLLLPHLEDGIERVVVCGRPTLSRPVTRLLARRDVEAVRVPAGRQGSTGDTGATIGTDRTIGTDDASAPGDWLTHWLDADTSARVALAEVLDEGPLSGPGVARAVAAATADGDLLVAGSSNAVRDLDLAEPWSQPPMVLANRGASGIDGTVSTAVGAALAHGGPAVALVGDLTFLHDSTGLVIGPWEPSPDLTIVVNNDDGGGLFNLLEQGAPVYSQTFERVFGTPHGVDLAALCAATDTPYVLAPTRADLAAALAPAPGIRVVEVRTDRGRSRDLHDRLRSAVAAAIG